MKENNKYRLYGKILFVILYIVSKTIRFKMVKSDKVREDENYTYGFWHNKLLVASLCIEPEKGAVLASPSKDGELVAVALEKLGFKVIRGSSGKDSVRSLIKLIGLVKKGYNAGTPVDGPKGPIYKVKPGMLYIAQKSGKKIIPMGGAFSSAWVFKKAWDKFNFPKPFSKITCVIGDPIEIPKDADLEEYSKILEDRINELDKEAEKMLNN